MGTLIELAWSAVFEAVAMTTGILALKAVSLGRIGLVSSGTGARLPWYGFGRDQDGRPAVTDGFAAFVGVLAWALILIGVTSVVIALKR